VLGVVLGAVLGVVLGVVLGLGLGSVGPQAKAETAITATNKIVISFFIFSLLSKMK
jgi:hypothetical protein